MSTAPSDTPAATPPPTGPGEGHLRRVLGVPSLVLFGMVYMVPLTVFTTYGIVTQLTGGRLSVAYLVTLAAMVFTARSYARMAAAYPVAGSAYAYTQKYVRGADRLPGRLVAAAGLPVPADAQLPGHRHLHERRDTRRARRGCSSWSRSPW